MRFAASRITFHGSNTRYQSCTFLSMCSLSCFECLVPGLRAVFAEDVHLEGMPPKGYTNNRKALMTLMTIFPKFAPVHLLRYLNLYN